MSARMIVLSLALVAITGCQSTAQQLNAEQQQAINVGVQRAKFDMNCPTATGSVLSREMIEPVSMRFGVQRAEYTIGVEGCGQRQSIVVLCPQDNSGCFAGGPRQ